MRSPAKLRLPTLPRMVQRFALVLAGVWFVGALPALAQSTAKGGAGALPGKVVISGEVPDEATRQNILTRAREIYGLDRVVDQLSVNTLSTPANWGQLVPRLISADLRRISRGQLKVVGSNVEVSGEVESDTVRQAVVAQMTAQLNPTYTVNNNLKVPAPGQELLDAALANRIVEFESGKPTLTALGQRSLDQIIPVLQQLKGRRFEVIGHTDNQGPRAKNIALSEARAESVKSYLMSKGVPGDAFETSGLGPDRPIAGNETADGRAKNRRIEFRVVQ